MFGWGKKEEKKPPNPRRKQDLSNVSVEIKFLSFIISSLQYVLGGIYLLGLCGHLKIIFTWSSHKDKGQTVLNLFFPVTYKFIMLN